MSVYEHYGLRAWKLFYDKGKSWTEEVVIGNPKQYEVFLCDGDGKWVVPIVRVVKLVNPISSNEEGSVRRPRTQRTILYRKYFSCPLCKKSLGILDYSLDSFPYRPNEITEEEVDEE